MKLELFMRSQLGNFCLHVIDSSKAYPVIISDDEIVDINTESDWEFADFLMKKRSNYCED